MEALIALKSSHFRNNCESKSAAFGPFFLTWIHESDPVTPLKTICHSPMLNWPFAKKV